MSRERSVKGRCKFNEDWLQDGKFKLWVAKSTTEHEFRCVLCKKAYTLGNTGVKASNVLRDSAKRKESEIECQGRT